MHGCFTKGGGAHLQQTRPAGLIFGEDARKARPVLCGPCAELRQRLTRLFLCESKGKLRKLFVLYMRTIRVVEREVRGRIHAFTVAEQVASSLSDVGHLRTVG